MLVFTYKHQPHDSLKFSKKLPFTVPEGVLIYTPVYSKLAVMLAKHSLLYHLVKVIKCKKNTSIPYYN